MERYDRLYNDEKRAIAHYQCNIELAESFYPCLSILEVALRNALSRELETMTGREDWYAVFPTTPGLSNLNHYITKLINLYYKNLLNYQKYNLFHL